MAMSLRDRLLSSNGCTFDSKITADYGEELYVFSVFCEADKEGSVAFCVNSPESISGVKGRIDTSGGKLTYEDKVLGFSMLADGQIAPVCAPWIFLKTLRSGYITACQKDGDGYIVQIEDSYQEDALHLDIWLDEEQNPLFAEILWQGRRILSLNVENFSFL